MTKITTDELRKILFDEYGGFADKRFKKLDTNRPFAVDDRTEGDLDARGNFFLWFCKIFANVDAPDRIRVCLSGGVPIGPEVFECLESFEAEEAGGGWEFTIEPGDYNVLLDLASAMEKIILRRYSEPAYKYVVPRTSASLKRLHEVLDDVWG